MVRSQRACLCALGAFYTCTRQRRKPRPHLQPHTPTTGVASDADGARYLAGSTRPKFDRILTSNHHHAHFDAFWPRYTLTNAQRIPRQPDTLATWRASAP